MSLLKNLKINFDKLIGRIPVELVHYDGAITKSYMIDPRYDGPGCGYCFVYPFFKIGLVLLNRDGTTAQGLEQCATYIKSWRKL